MFKPSVNPRFFGLAMGVDFPAAIVSSILDRLQNTPPETIANTVIYVNTSRMQRRLQSLFAARGAMFLPRILLITQITEHPALIGLPQPMPKLRRRLVLAQLVRKLLKTAPDLAPQHAAFELADSLASLLDEMQGEGVGFDDLRELDVAHHSAHWERSLKFLSIVETYLADQVDEMDSEAQQRAAVDRLSRVWEKSPPQHPVMVVGSTGSRGATAKFMHLVASLPQGAVVLPGFDVDMPQSTWAALGDALSGEDHPQFRFKQFMEHGVHDWIKATPVSSTRNRLVSLALRPAPVTNEWLSEGPKLGDLVEATKDITLIEANSRREESQTIALALRKAVEDGVSAALITPDRELSRQVSAALDRWNIRADDSAGLPLHLTPPGRFLRLVAGFFGQAVTAESLLILLKHPLTCSIKDQRGAHLRWVRELELRLRRYGPAFPTADDLSAWATAQKEDGLVEWVDWINACFAGCNEIGTQSLSDHLTHHLKMANQLAAGPDDSEHQLWAEDEGKAATKIMEGLQDEAHQGGKMAPFEYAALLHSLLQDGEARSSVEAHPDVMIWGTLEARVQGADLVILGGLNEGIWPGDAAPDPWLNRSLRHQAGLLLPERRIGLAAHDFQQAIAAPKVILTRAIRNAEAETVPSRWLYRLTSLLDGLRGDQNGNAALAEMRFRGRAWQSLAQALDRPDAPVVPMTRPSPCPPIDVRPKLLSVTEIQTLIRDPYAIYAKHVLGLTALDPLRPTPDPRLRGTIIHEIFHKFSKATKSGMPENAIDLLLTTTDDVFAKEIPWPATRRIWRARLARNAHWFVETEIARRKLATPTYFETKGHIPIPNTPVAIKGTADRIDVAPDGQLIIYDYKTGSPPSPNVIQSFDKQLLIEAAMAENGGFMDSGPSPVSGLVYIGLARTPKEQKIDLTKHSVSDVWAGLSDLLGQYQSLTKGYTSRRAMQKEADARDFDHLARFHEWDVSDASDPQLVTK
ncbi:putative Helicase/Exonuclease [Rhodobacteraceae bacterium HTCC2150]|nr:putative Helicase/Exonuclease [Rhodobacteraceae bacterium HTCC2150]